MESHGKQVPPAKYVFYGQVLKHCWFKWIYPSIQLVQVKASLVHVAHGEAQETQLNWDGNVPIGHEGLHDPANL